MSRFKKQVNPEFKEFVNNSIADNEKILNELASNISGKKFEDIYKNKIDEIIKTFSEIKKKFELFTTNFKFYTEETERSLRKFGFLMKEMTDDLNFNKNAYSKEENEIYLLNIVNKWSIYNTNIKELYYNIENHEYPYTIHTVFTLAFVLVPFLNIFSLVGGIYLVTKKDWRALILGLVALILYFLQFINVIYLAVVG